MRGQEVAVEQRVVARGVRALPATKSTCGAAVDVRQQSALGSGHRGRRIVAVSGFRGIEIENLTVVIKVEGALAVGERHSELVEGGQCESTGFRVERVWSDVHTKEWV